MCGISGVYGSHASFKAVAITLGQLNRGEKGCGVAYLSRDGLKISKEPTSPVRFFVQHHLELYNNSMVAIGHNRQPSVGKVNWVNTHPFLSCHKEFALVHNGSMFNHDIMKKLKAEGHRIKGETDSEALCHQLEKLYWEHRNMVDAINGLYEYNFNGAILVLLRDGTLYGMRDSIFPLCVAQDGREIYLASTKDAIESFKGRNVKAVKLEPWQIVEIRRGKLKIHKAIHKEELVISEKMGKYTVYRWFPNIFGNMD